MSRVTASVGLIGYLVVGFFPYLVSTLVVPVTAAIVLWLIWAAGFGVVVAMFRRRSKWTIAAAPAAIALWVAYVQAGSWIFGWTA